MKHFRTLSIKPHKSKGFGGSLGGKLGSKLGSKFGRRIGKLFGKKWPISICRDWPLNLQDFYSRHYRFLR